MGLVKLITGHCLLNKHLSKWRVLPTKSCHLCEEEDETYYHFIFDCLATTLARREILKSSYNRGAGPLSKKILYREGAR